MRKIKFVASFVILAFLISSIGSWATEGPPIYVKGCACVNAPPLNTGKCVFQFSTGLVDFYAICKTAHADEVKDCKGVIVDCGGVH